MENNELLRKEQKQEALERMKMLKVFTPTIKEFEKDGVLNKSVSGFLYWLSDAEKQMVEDFEKEHNALVYHVIYSNTEFGELLSLLYVSQDKEEWTDDRIDIEHGMTFSYVINLDCDWCSEFGSIGIKNQFGGLVRIY